MASDKTEQPTSRRRTEARRKGQVARSKDLVHAGTMAAVLVALAFAGGAVVQGLGGALAAALRDMGRFPARDLRLEDVGPLAFDGLRTLALLVAPIAGTAMVAVIALFSAQGGWVIATEALQLRWDRLSPATGVRKLGLSTGGLDTVKLAVMVTALAFIGYRVVSETLLQSGGFARLSPFDAGLAGWSKVERLLRQAALVMVTVGVVDYMLQRWRLTKSLKMTKQEVKDDVKMTEGNPEIKARVRRIQWTMARKRMLAAVPKATVVVTNPTHYAVALEYQRSAMFAPRVVAKGRGHLAQRIKALAREHGVPTVENVPLAQALYKTVEVGDFIPAALFEAVAEVLAYLIRLKQLAL